MPSKKPSSPRSNRRATAPRSGGRKIAAKVSPLRGMPVAEWVSKKTDGWQTAVVKHLLDLAEKAAPDAAVAIKWGQPVLDLGGPLAFIRVAKAHVTFGFWRGAELTDEKGVLEGGARMKHLKIASGADVDDRLIGRLVREAAALNRAKGDPSARRRS